MRSMRTAVVTEADDRADDHEGQHPQGGVALEEDQPGRQGTERTDHEDLAVGEVDQLDDAVDDRVADRDQGVERSQGQPVDELLGEGVHRDLLVDGNGLGGA